MLLYPVVCMYCKEMAIIRNIDDGKEGFDYDPKWQAVSSGVCPCCKEKHMPELKNRNKK